MKQHFLSVFEQARINHTEKWLSSIGGLISLMGILLISHHSLGMEGASTLVASMGATAVLLFAAPHGPMSQPWAVIGGHVVSAFVGIMVVKYTHEPLLAAALAVSLAIAAMHYLDCVHPPGGATALSAVIGGDAVQQLGFQFIVTPVLLNVITILMIAVLFNYPFAWRRYPASLLKLSPATASAEDNS